MWRATAENRPGVVRAPLVVPSITNKRGAVRAYLFLQGKEQRLHGGDVMEQVDVMACDGTA